MNPSLAPVLKEGTKLGRQRDGARKTLGKGNIMYDGLRRGLEGEPMWLEQIQRR